MMNKKKLIAGISGKIGAGKTTFGDMLINKLTLKGFKVRFLNFADKLKEICFVLTGYRGITQEEKQIFLPNWNKTVGQILQQLGTDVMRNNFDQDVWVKSTFSEIERDNETDIFIVGDCRFPNEANIIKTNKPTEDFVSGLVYRINGDPADVRKNSTRDLNHESETSLDNYNEFDVVYENIGSLEDLEKFVEKHSELICKYLT